MRKRLSSGRSISLLQGLFLAPAIAIAVLGVSVLFGQPAFAISIVPACAKTGLPDLNCAVTAFVNVARLIFSVTGSFALFMFIIGGFKILSSAGNDTKVKEGKEYIKNAVIGIFIILTAAYVIEYGYRRLTGNAGSQCGDGAMFAQTTADPKTGKTTTKQLCCHTGRATNPEVLYQDTKGVQRCASACTDITGYSCQNTDTRPQKTEGCFVGICPKTAEWQCCPK